MCDYNLHSVLKQEWFSINLAKHVLKAYPSIQEVEITLKSLLQFNDIKGWNKDKAMRKTNLYWFYEKVFNYLISHTNCKLQSLISTLAGIS